MPGTVPGTEETQKQNPALAIKGLIASKDASAPFPQTQGTCRSKAADESSEVDKGERVRCPSLKEL